jgi:hypothetical protein
MAGPSRLNPGEKGRIIARIGHLPATGSVTEKIEVVSNDPKRKSVILMLHATAAAPSPFPSLTPLLDHLQAAPK